MLIYGLNLQHFVFLSTWQAFRRLIKRELKKLIGTRAKTRDYSSARDTILPFIAKKTGGDFSFLKQTQTHNESTTCAPYAFFSRQVHAWRSSLGAWSVYNTQAYIARLVRLLASSEFSGPQLDGISPLFICKFFFPIFYSLFHSFCHHF